MQMSKEVHILKLDEILPNRFQPRIVFDETAINELAESIKEYGVIEPIIVRRVADKYEIIAGERRYKASVLAGKETIPAIITELNDKDSAEIALIENVQRQNLTPIEEAVSYKKILDMGYMNQSELADKLGKTQSTVANKLRLLNLTDEVQEALLQERISERHARSLLRLPNDKQNAMLERITKERMTVRKTDEEINKILNGNVESGSEKIVESIPTPMPTIQSIPSVSEIKEEKEEKNMNSNDFMNQFNIPNSPIVETPQIQPIVEETQNNNQVVSPVMPTINSQFDGNVVSAPNVFETNNQFMSQTELVNPFSINSINEEIKSDSQVQTINNEPATEENTDTPISGRFFNMFGSEPTVEETPITNNNIEQNLNTFKPQIQPMYQPIDFNPFGSTTVTEAPEVEPNITNNDFINNVQNLEPIPMPNVPIVPEMQSPVAQPEMISQVQPFQLNDNQEFTNSSVVELGTLGNNRIEEPTLEPLMETNKPLQKVEMKEIINMIRECASKIEKCGYVIDTDELDFDDNYQVIFKIDKKD